MKFRLDKLEQDTLARLPDHHREAFDSMCLRGSHAHGTYIPPQDADGTDDIDVFCLSVRPRDFYLGNHSDNTYTFETAGEDLDILVYDIRKFVGLLQKGNPNVQMVLWQDEADFSTIGPAMRVLRDQRRDFLSRAVIDALLGYSRGQRHLMTRGGTKARYMGAKRQALMEKHGYDTKNAAHCLRLMLTGCELAITGELPVRLAGLNLERVLRVKRGEFSLEHAQRMIAQTEDVLQSLVDQAKHPWMKTRVSSDVANEALLAAMYTHWIERAKQAMKVEGK